MFTYLKKEEKKKRIEEALKQNLKKRRLFKNKIKKEIKNNK